MNADMSRKNADDIFLKYINENLKMDLRLITETNLKCNYGK